MPPTFADAAAIANEILKSDYSFEEGKIIYNRFKSVVSYQTSDMPLFKLNSITAAPKIAVYDSIDDDVLKSYLEFSIASLIFYAMKEGACRLVQKYQFKMKFLFLKQFKINCLIGGTLIENPNLIPESLVNLLVVRL